MKTYNNLGLLVLRMTIGLLMLLHGFSKLSGGLDFIQSMLESKGLPGFLSYGVLVGEILAPIAIIIGYRTRIASSILAFNCLVAILLVHQNELFTISSHGGWAVELLGLYLFGSIALIFTGGGKYAITK
ncbi:MAG: DoxX family protein [Bacteroidaceae bacterium]